MIYWSSSPSDTPALHESPRYTFDIEPFSPYFKGSDWNKQACTVFCTKLTQQTSNKLVKNIDYHSDKVLRHILLCSSSPLVVAKISDKQTNDTTKGKLPVGSSYLCSYTFRGCNCQSAAGSKCVGWWWGAISRLWSPLNLDQHQLEQHIQLS